MYLSVSGLVRLMMKAMTPITARAARPPRRILEMRPDLGPEAFL